MVLVQKQTQRQTEQNRRTRHKFTQLQPFDFSQGSQKHDGVQTVSLTNVAGDTGYLHAED
jgi:hypothetical protein